MEKEFPNRVSIKDVAESISYFGAGSFLIWTILSSKSADGGLEPISWFICVVGTLLIVAGFVALIIIPLKYLPFKHLSDFGKVLELKYKKYINALVFAIAATTVAVTAIDFHSYTPLFVTSIVFLFIVMLVIIITSWSVFKNASSLLTLTLTLNVLAISLLFTGANKIQLTTVLGLSIVFLFLALSGITKRKTQTP